MAQYKDVDAARGKPLGDVEELQYVQGHLVFFPVHFLAEQDLSSSALTKEYYVPKATFQ